MGSMDEFIKKIAGKVPDWTETFEEFSESADENVHVYK
jgi:hypothetical protein